MPEHIREQFIKENGNSKGLYAVDGVVKKWLQAELGEAG
jgi:hypothetical protein